MGCGASAEAPTNGTRLEFTVESASGLPNTETIGMIDPYCTIMFQPKVLTWKTEEIENSQTPTWNAFFHCNVTPEEEEKGDLHICLWNKNTSSDDYLGDVWTSCKGLAHNQPHSRELTLKNSPEGATDAKVKIVIRLVDFGENDAQKDTPGSAHTFRPAKDGYQPPASFAAMYSGTNFQQQQGYPQQQPPQQQPPQQQQGYPQQQPPQQQPPQQQPPQQQPGYQQPPPQQHHQQPPPQQHHQQPPPQQHHQQPPPQQHHQEHHQQHNQNGSGCLVFLHGAHGQNLSANPEGHLSISPNTGHWEQWTMEKHGNEVVFRSHHNTYLNADPNTSAGLAPHAQGWEKWVLTANPDAHGKFAIRSAHGTFLRSFPDGKVDVAPTAQGWEAWEIIPTGPVFLVGAHGQSLSSTPEGRLHAATADGLREQWNVEKHGNEVVLRSHHNTYLNADPNTSAGLAPHVQGWEKWVLTPHPEDQSKFAIRSAHGTFLRSFPDGKVDVAPTAQGWEAWEFKSV